MKVGFTGMGNLGDKDQALGRAVLEVTVDIQAGMYMNMELQ